MPGMRAFEAGAGLAEFAEYQLVAAKTIGRFEHFESKPAFTTKSQYRAGAGYFKGQTSNPIPEIVPSAHAAEGLVVAPKCEWAQTDRAAYHAAEIEPKEVIQQHQRLKGRRGLTKSLLDPPPALADHTLIVVDGEEEASAGLYATAGIVNRLPHLASVMENTPRINDIKLA